MFRGDWLGIRQQLPLKQADRPEVRYLGRSRNKLECSPLHLWALKHNMT